MISSAISALCALLESHFGLVERIWQAYALIIRFSFSIRYAVHNLQLDSAMQSAVQSTTNTYILKANLMQTTPSAVAKLVFWKMG